MNGGRKWGQVERQGLSWIKRSKFLATGPLSLLYVHCESLKGHVLCCISSTCLTTEHAFYSTFLQPVKTGFHDVENAILNQHYFDGRNVFLIMDGITMAEILQENRDLVYV